MDTPAPSRVVNGLPLSVDEARSILLARIKARVNRMKWLVDALARNVDHVHDVGQAYPEALAAIRAACVELNIGSLLPETPDFKQFERIYNLPAVQPQPDPE